MSDPTDGPPVQKPPPAHFFRDDKEQVGQHPRVMDKLRALTFFCHVVEAKSFTAAADALGVVPSAVSRAIATLEADIGFKVFHRTTRHMSLTEDGAQYYERCRRLLHELEEMEALAREGRARPAGVLRVGMHPAVNGLLMWHIREFLAQYPEIIIETTVTNAPAALVELGLDVVACIGDLPDSTFPARRIATTRFLIVAAPGYVEAHGAPETPQDLARHSVVLASRRDLQTLARWSFERDGFRETVILTPRIISRDAVFMRDALLGGAGICRMFEFPLRSLIAEGRVKVLLQDWSCGEIPIHAVYPDARQVPTKVRVFSDFLRRLLANASAGMPV